MSRLTALFSVVFPLTLLAQQKGDRFFMGEASLTAYTYNNLSNGNNNDKSKTYILDCTLDYGRFNKDNRSVQYGLIGGLTYQDDNYTMSNGDLRYYWMYRVGAHLTLKRYFPLLPSFYATVGNDFSYMYSWQKGNSFSSNDKAHHLGYRLSPGLFYRATPRLGFNLALDLFTIRAYTNISSNGSRYNRLDMRVFASSNVNQIYFGVIWFPFAAKKDATK